MASPRGNTAGDGGSFSFGEMALSAEPGRATPGGFNSRIGVSDVNGEDSVNETLLHQMRVLMLNEQFSPEVLQFATSTTEGVRELVTVHSDTLDEVEFSNKESSVGFETHIKRMELDRINYLLRSYYRTRIKKIENAILFIFKDEDTFGKLSKSEQKFAVSYMNLVEGHFNRSFLSMLPDKLRRLDNDGNVDPAVPPDLERFAFCRIQKTIGSYAVSDDATDVPIDLNEGDILCTRYSRIRELIINGNAELV
eukprot:IDg10120t1